MKTFILRSSSTQLIGYSQSLSFFFFFQPHVGFQFPNQESNLGPLHWKFGVLTMDRQGSPCAVFPNGPFERSPPYCVLLAHKTT